jgi:hypothetical protein
MECIQKVLVQIAVGGWQTRYEIQKKTKISHGSVHNSTETLRDVMGAIVNRTIGVTRKKEPLQEWGLTEYGLCLAMDWRLSESIERKPERPADEKIFKMKIISDYKQIVTNWGGLLPLPLKKWGVLSEHIADNELIAALFASSKAITNQKKGSVSNIERSFAELFFMPLTEVFPEPLSFSLGNWIQAIQADLDLKDFVRKSLLRKKKLSQTTYKKEKEHQDKMLIAMSETDSGENSSPQLSSPNGHLSSHTIASRLFKINFLYHTVYFLKKRDGIIENTVRNNILQLLECDALSEKPYWLERFSLIAQYLV